ncbi:hypothetical protein M569_11777 [Genlisea aurea]|uniref:Uncharacterized protein n=1 Tax=Genlisea aurea TaxID=192259 RepID=S8CES6_9LAMI|nr:hypothetical protein M569_11777 [Genlisea aurea]
MALSAVPPFCGKVVGTTASSGLLFHGVGLDVPRPAYLRQMFVTDNQCVSVVVFTSGIQLQDKWDA